MKILLVSLEAPNGRLNGLRLPLSRLLAGLDGRTELRLVTFRLPDQSELADGTAATSVPRVEPSGRARVLEGARSTILRAPASAHRFRRLLQPAVASAVADDRPDLVHVFGGPLAGLGDDLAGLPGILTAMDAASHNIRARADVASGLRRAALLDEERRTIRHQRQHYGQFRRVVMVTPQDAATIRGLVPGAVTSVIPNGVDVPADDGTRHGPDQGPTVLFHGALSYAPNVLAVRHLIAEVWPIVRQARPDATLLLVGRSPAAEITRLARADGVQLVGEVADVWPWLRGATVYACPMTSGTGIKNKLLEAMGAGLPCVVSPLATRGLDVVDGTQLVVAGRPEDMAEAIVGLLGDPQKRTVLGAAAAAHVGRHHSWSAFADAYVHLYTDVLAEAGVNP